MLVSFFKTLPCRGVCCTAIVGHYTSYPQHCGSTCFAASVTASHSSLFSGVAGATGAFSLFTLAMSSLMRTALPPVAMPSRITCSTMQPSFSLVFNGAKWHTTAFARPNVK